MRCGDRLQAGALRSGRHLQQLVARQHQLPDQGHQFIEQVHSNADGFRRGVTRSGVQNLLRSQYVFRFCQPQCHQNLTQTPAVSFFLFLQGLHDVFGLHISALDQNAANFGAGGFSRRAWAMP
jgi:hypothetical protein